METPALSLAAYIDTLDLCALDRDRDNVGAFGSRLVRVEFKTCGQVAVALYINASGEFVLGDQGECTRPDWLPLWSLAWARAASFIGDNNLRAAKLPLVRPWLEMLRR